MLADVAFPVARPLILTYLVPQNLEANLRIGQKVRIPLGKSERSGLVLAIKSDSKLPAAKMREVRSIESDTPYAPEDLLRVSEWVAQYYCCSIGQVIRQFFCAAKPGKPKEPAMPEFEPHTELILTPDQEKAFGEIEKNIASGAHKVILLHGVTGSGKTAVYLRAVRCARSLGKSVLVLVPEIALTDALFQNIARYIREPIALLHSRMSAGERSANWTRIRNGECKIALGARSCVWAPLENLGLVVVDEEHDRSYKQNEGIPRYHARDVAVYRAFMQNATVVLGSATPSIESYAHARNAKYRLVELPQRFGCARLPDVQVVDMRNEHASGRWGYFSRLLLEKIENRLAKSEQIILLLNRRGFCTLLLCRTCGHIARCPRCEIATTYHATDHNLHCHYCGYKKEAPDLCPACGGSELKYHGLGVQRVEKEILDHFPAVRIVRMDTDTTRRAKSHTEILGRFARLEADLLIGTQMVAKGLDFPNVTLVGIVSADTGLNMPDFRASENTFQLLSQVAGRSGRGQRPGEVVLQTYSPDEAAIVCATRHDYKTFYEIERQNRRSLGYPPFMRLVQITLTHASDKILLKSSAKLVTLLKNESRGAITIMGPAPAPLAKQKGRYRMLILMKSASVQFLHDMLAAALAGFTKGPVQMIVDVDPTFML